MSRGPGHVLRTMQNVLLDAPPEHPWTYESLAERIYRSGRPNRSQLSSVARATTQLLDQGHVTLERWVDDARVNLVRHQDPIDHARRLVAARSPEFGYSYEQLASRIYWARLPTESQLAATTRAIELLVADGRVQVVEASNVPVPIVISVPSG